MITPMDKLKQLKDYMDYYVGMLTLRHNSFDRVITDKEVFGRHKKIRDRYQLIHKNMEVTSKRWNEHPGWGKPDVIIHDVEVHKFYKDMPIKTFSEWAK